MANPYPVKLQAPDISPYREGNTGVEFITTFDSAKPGPHVMLCAIVHGNELCGAITLDFLFRQQLRPLHGKLTLAFMNTAAYERFDPASPDAARYVDEDFNRLWDEKTLNGPRDSVELRRARAVRPIIDQVDHLLDLHSMQHPTVPLLLCGPAQKGRALARALGFPPHAVADAGHAAGRRLRDYGAFADDTSPKNALLIECGQHWEPSSETVAKEMAIRFLAHHEVIDPGFASAHLPQEPPAAQRLIEVTEPVTIKTDRFRFVADYRGMELIEQGGTLIAYDGDEEVRTPYDHCVLIMPSRRLRKGESAVRYGRYVD